jgi:hypothetical protein
MLWSIDVKADQAGIVVFEFSPLAAEHVGQGGILWVH